MKTIIVSILTLVFVATGWSQNLSSIYQQHLGDGNYTKVQINGELFKLAASMSDDKDNMSAAEGITGIRILSADDLKDEAIRKNLMTDIWAFFENESYVEFMRVEENNEKVVFYLKKSGKKIVELSLVVDDDVTVIQINGDLDLAQMSKLSNTMNIKGMDKLEEIEEK
ncbi:MAG: DUF4252 domain-containing protein [Salinivirgaceae bacterium]|jgi:hypothetical protein|nr:DUF4252 domain-containing protein [Salinivirgaceae bacterium]